MHTTNPTYSENIFNNYGFVIQIVKIYWSDKNLPPKKFIRFRNLVQKTMDYTTYLAIVAILQAVVSLKAIIWPKELAGLKNENRRRYLKSMAQGYQLRDGVLYKTIEFKKTIKQRAVEGKHGWDAFYLN